MSNKPIKRHQALQPLSRDHHHGLLLCWKIKEGFKRNIEPERIRRYTDWFWQNHLTAHFEEEEKHIFPILGNDHELIKRAVSEHRRLKHLFEQEIEIVGSLSLIEEELKDHIRFEERVLFNEIQQAATPGQLLEVEKHHSGTTFCDNWEDEFWK